MQIFENLIAQIITVFENGVFGISLFDLGIIFISIVFALLIRSFFAKLIVLKLKKIVKKTSTELDDSLYDALIPPFKLLPIVLAFLAITLYFEIDSTLGLYFQKINNTLATIFVFWLIHQALIPFSIIFSKLEKILTKA
jgi:MscS family membrane protein